MNLQSGAFLRQDFTALNFIGLLFKISKFLTHLAITFIDISGVDITNRTTERCVAELSDLTQFSHFRDNVCSTQHLKHPLGIHRTRPNAFIGYVSHNKQMQFASHFTLSFRNLIN